jgi:hypothetical protein
MASSGKRKTTMAKLNRERRLLERRLEKQAKKDARKRASALQADQPSDAPIADDGVSQPPPIPREPRTPSVSPGQTT